MIHSNIALIRKHYYRNKGKTIVALILLLFGAIFTLVTPAISGKIVDKVFISKNIGALTNYLIILTVVFVISNSISFLQDYTFMRLRQELSFSLQSDLINKIFFLPKKFFDNIQSGYLNARINEIGLISNFFSSSVIILLGDILKFGGATIFCFSYNFKLSIIAIAFLPLCFILIKKNSNRIRESSTELAELDAQLDAVIIERLASIELIKSFVKESFETYYLESRIRNKIKKEIKQSIISTISSRIVALIFGLNSFLLVWVSALEIIAGRLTVGEYIAFMGYLFFFTTPLHSITNSFLMFQNVSVACKRVNEFFEMVDEKNNSRKKSRFEKLSYGITFHDICFGYSNAPQNVECPNTFVLNKLTFFIGVNEKVLIKGINGSGKSTIISLLLGFYEPLKGCIKYDNVNLTDIDLQSLREKIGLVSQNIILLDDTIINNIRYGDPKADDEKVIEAAKKAGAHEFIISFMDGYNTRVGETGKKLSGGQRQKLAIARALLKNANIIILDEPDSHLDEKSIADLNHTFLNCFYAKTCIVISHKQNIPWIDKSYILEEGKLVRFKPRKFTEKSKGIL